MSERRVGLDLGTPGATTSGSDSSGLHERSRGQADPALVDDFRARLAGGGEAATTPAPVAQGPFGLLGAGAMRGEAPDSRRLQIVEETAERLLVSDGGGSGGSAEIRIELKDDLLPGVELRIAERDGELRFEFVAADPESAAWLAAQCESIARELAARLRREVRVLVRRGDDVHGEVLAEHVARDAATAADGPASVFAGRMPGMDRE